MEWMPKILRSPLGAVLAAALAAVCFSAPAGVLAGEDGAWKCVSHKDGVTLCTQEVPDCPLDRVQGEITVHQPLAVVGAVMMDMESYPQWMPGVVEAGVLEQKSPFALVAYNVVDAQWPLADRDAVFSVTVSHEIEKGTVSVCIRAVSYPGFPKKPGRVRMKAVDGLWEIERIGDNETRVRYTVLADPGGDIPTFLKNSGNRMFVRDTLKGLREAAHSARYREMAQKLAELETRALNNQPITSGVHAP